MSYLLDALKKSEQEQTVAETPHWQSDPIRHDDFVEARGETPLWLWILIGLMSINLLGLGYLLWQNQRQSVSVPSLTQGAVATVPSEQSTQQQTRLQEHQQNTQTASEAIPTKTARLREYQPGASSNQIHSQANGKYASVAVGSSTVNNDTAAVNKVAATPQTAPDDSKLIPSIEQLPANTRNQLPAIQLETHVHSSNAAKSFVMINGRMVGEGESIGNGVTVHRIEQETVVFEFRNDFFKMPALGRWPNS